MTAFRLSLLPAAFLLIPLPLQGASLEAQARARGDSCSDLSPSVERKCREKRVEGKERLLDDHLSRGRKAVERSFSKYGHRDNRTHPRFLDRSQAAWKQFVVANCNVAAAYGGGSNSAISDRWGDCYEEELDRRTAFLRDLAAGTGAFGP